MFSSKCYSQISLEHSYPNGSTMAPTTQTGYNHLYVQPLMVNLEIDGYKYVILDRPQRKIDFYNLDHTLFKSISFTITGTVLDHLISVLYISQTLFDVDPKIEFLVCYGFGTGVPAIYEYHTWVFNEDDNVLFYDSLGGPAVKFDLHQQQYPIYNTPSGTKMILSMTNGNANIYSLPGVLVPSIANNESFISDRSLSNPTTGKTLKPLPYFNNQVQENKID